MDDGSTTGQEGVVPTPGRAENATPAVRSHRQPRSAALRAPAWWLLVVLIVQAALSIRLLRSDTAFEDEATYLWAGHLEWAHWLHGTPIPPFPSYFSGAPIIYPPIGALADSVGGLTGARALSLVFMLGATALLWGGASRLFGHRAAFFAAALFAVLGSTLHLGSFATYDAMSLFLVALATWCVIRAGDRRDATGWMFAAGGALALANATEYASALFDPVVIIVALLIAFPKPGGKLAAARCITLIVVVVILITAGLLVGGSHYVSGVKQTTLERVGGPVSAATVFTDSWSWTGVVAVLALCGVLFGLFSREEGGARKWLLAVLAAAALLAPLEHAHLHIVASLNKHVDLGAWFAAIAAGYAVDRFIAAASAGRVRDITCGACVLALAFPLALGARQSFEFATDWSNAASFIALLRPMVDKGDGRLLVEDPSIAEYYLPAGHHWERWSSTRNIVMPSGDSTGGPTSAAGVTGPGNAGVFAAYITRGYFSLVALNFADTTALDHLIRGDLRRSGHYKLKYVIPYGLNGTYVIWLLKR
jgi:Dolichyl-phosphate-mannose-protein mannosyltransferase